MMNIEVSKDSIRKAGSKRRLSVDRADGRGTGKERKFTKIVDTNDVFISCAYGCGVVYRTPAKYVYRRGHGKYRPCKDAESKKIWHNVIRRLNAHEKRCCPLRPGFIRKRRRREIKKSELETLNRQRLQNVAKSATVEPVKHDSEYYFDRTLDVDKFVKNEFQRRKIILDALDKEAEEVGAIEQLKLEISQSGRLTDLPLLKQENNEMVQQNLKRFSIIPLPLLKQENDENLKKRFSVISRRSGSGSSQSSVKFVEATRNRSLSDFSKLASSLPLVETLRRHSLFPKEESLHNRRSISLEDFKNIRNNSKRRMTRRSTALFRLGMSPALSNQLSLGNEYPSWNLSSQLSSGSVAPYPNPNLSSQLSLGSVTPLISNKTLSDEILSEMPPMPPPPRLNNKNSVFEK